MNIAFVPSLIAFVPSTTLRGPPPVQIVSLAKVITFVPSSSSRALGCSRFVHCRHVIQLHDTEQLRDKDKRHKVVPSPLSAPVSPSRLEASRRPVIKLRAAPDSDGLAGSTIREENATAATRC